MFKRLYKRFLEWALGPVLEPVTEAVVCLQAQAAMNTLETSDLRQEFEVLCSEFSTQQPNDA